MERRDFGDKSAYSADSPINENWPSRFSAEPVCTSNCGLTYADDRLIVGVVEKVPVFTFEVLGETQHLKAVAITDGPELQLVSVAVPLALAIAVPLDPAYPMRNLIHGSIGARRPAP